jgi:hypothetical protein
MLALYRKMVAPGSWAFVEILDSDLVGLPLPEGVVASAYVNDAFSLVLANYGRAAATVTVRHRYLDATDPANGPLPPGPISLAPRTLRILSQMPLQKLDTMESQR